MEEVNKLIQKTKEAYPELDYEIEAIRLSYQDDLDYGYDEEHVINLIKIEISNLIKQQ